MDIAARRAERESGVPHGFHIWRTPLGTLTLRDGTPAALREALLDATPDVVAGMPLAGGRGTVWAVTLGPGASVWYNAVLRADGDTITVGANSNLQDNVSVHVDPGHPVLI